MSTFDDEHGLPSAPVCPVCGYPGCVRGKGCDKRRREKRHRDEIAALRAEVERLRVERDEYRAEVELRDALLRADVYEEMRQHAQELALRLAVAERERDEALKAKDEQLEDSERIISALVRERDEARADAALLRIALENAEPIEAERDDLRAEVERLRAELDEALESRGEVRR